MLNFGKVTTPDGSYGPFHFNCMIVVKDGAVSLIDPQPQGDGTYSLAPDGSSLSFVPAPVETKKE